MRWARVLYKKTPFWARFNEEDVRLTLFDGNLFHHVDQTGYETDIGEVEFLPPCNPRRIIGIGLNYNDHIREMGHDAPSKPVVFFKDPGSIILSGDPIPLPAASDRVEYEGELGVIISEECYRIRERETDRCIGGYVCVNDVTARDLQKTDNQWYRAKSFPGFCPVGPIIDTEKKWRGRRIRTFLNGKIVQDSFTDEMRFGVSELISYVSGFIRLSPGDLILTGTPAGVGPLSPRDRIEIEIDGIGRIRNDVVEDEERKRVTMTRKLAPKLPKLGISRRIDSEKGTEQSND